jgi:hypothetical protein
MKKALLLFAILSVCIAYAQINFENGYFINNSGSKTDVLIKNIDWLNNPSEIEYKVNETSAPKKESIKNIQEFGIYGGQKFVRKTLMLDRSSDDLNKISEVYKPEYREETLFLKYLVEGKNNLLYYEDGGLKRFFYSSGDSAATQLVYKPYYVDPGQLSYNTQYKNQLSTLLKCDIQQIEIEKLKYEKKDLISLFSKDNNCSTGNSTDYTKTEKKRDLFNLNIRPGINFSKLQTEEYFYLSTKTVYDQTTAFRIGLEFEFILPFNKNKWSLFVEPTYQYYKSEKETLIDAGTILERKSSINVDYKSVELPLGVRHYFYLNETSKLFVNVAYVIDFQLKSAIKRERSELEIDSGNNIIFGAGYKYNDKLSFELRIGTPRNLLQNYLYYTSDYNTVSLIFGYTFF